MCTGLIHDSIEVGGGQLRCFLQQGSRDFLKHSLQFPRGSTLEVEEDPASPVFQAGLKKCHRDVKSACSVTLSFQTFILTTTIVILPQTQTYRWTKKTPRPLELEPGPANLL